MTKVVIVINENVMYMGWERLLHDNFGEVEIAVARNIPDALAHVNACVPDLIILSASITEDYSRSFQMAKMNLLSRNIPFLVYYDPAVFKIVIQYLKNGANGSVSYLCELDIIIAAVAALLKGDRFICPLSEKLIITHLLGVESTIGEKRQRDLSVREMEIAGYLTKGFKTSDIGKKLNLKVSTISTVKFKIFSKMKVTNIVQLAEKMKTV